MAHTERPRWAPALDRFGIAAFATVYGFAAYRLAGAVDSIVSVAIVLVTLPIGYLLADVAAGTMHWFCDSFFEEDTPFIGPLFMRPFREHHRDPLSITRHGFLELNGNSCVAVAPLAALSFIAVDPASGLASLSIFAIAFAFFGAAACTNQLHRWAHDVNPSRGARVLQRLHLILPPDHHQVHHTPPFIGHYCVTNGWMNSALERIRFWRAAEWVAVRLGIPKSREA
jgi:hypothetical protein